MNKTIIKYVITYGPVILFIIIRMPKYKLNQGFIWTDMIIAGILGILGSVIYKYIERNQRKN